MPMNFLLAKKLDEFISIQLEGTIELPQANTYAVMKFQHTK
jgi:hypothetical protein